MSFSVFTELCYYHDNETVNHLEDNAGLNLCYLGLGNDFLDLATRAQMIKKKAYTLSKFITHILSRSINAIRNHSYII
jgi:hypothetical protein